MGKKGGCKDERGGCHFKRWEVLVVQWVLGCFSGGFSEGFKVLHYVLPDRSDHGAVVPGIDVGGGFL